jgi:aspartyl-tRNA(Asn)/glutamyl-tRNA(Gln) amidotransferase subunit A
VTTRGSVLFRDRVATTDATAVARLRAAGGIPFQVPRRYWHVGPMARSVRDVAAAFHLLCGPGGVDGHVGHAPPHGQGPQDLAGLRVGWACEPAFGPVDREVVATVTTAAEALRELGCVVEAAPPAGLEAVDATALSAVLFTAEVVPYFRRVAAGRESELHPVIQRTITAPEVPLSDYR